jgi:hypothetical protein
MSRPRVRLAKYHNPTSKMSTPRRSETLRPRSSCLGRHAGSGGSGGGGGGVDAGGAQPGGGPSAAGGVECGVRVVLVSSESVMVSLRDPRRARRHPSGRRLAGASRSPWRTRRAGRRLSDGFDQAELPWITLARANTSRRKLTFGWFRSCGTTAGSGGSGDEDRTLLGFRQAGFGVHRALLGVNRVLGRPSRARASIGAPGVGGRPPCPNGAMVPLV